MLRAIRLLQLLSLGILALSASPSLNHAAEDVTATDNPDSAQPASSILGFDLSSWRLPTWSEIRGVFAGQQPTAATQATVGASNTDSVQLTIPAAAPSSLPIANSSPEPSNQATATQPPLDPQMLALRDKVRRALAIYQPKHLNTRDHSPWEVMHGIIAYGVDTQLFRGGPGGTEVNAISWMCSNGACQGDSIFFTDRGKLAARKGPGLQGHYGQLLAILAQSHVKMDYPIYVGGKSFTLHNLIEHEQSDCEPGEELTFKLIGMAHYLDPDATWTNRNGEAWDIERLVREELKQPIRGAACGGTHRLMGLTYSYKKRIQRGRPMTGDFVRAQKFITDYQKYTFAMQNPDGSFSTEWFVRSGSNPDEQRRLKTSGHILEWLAFSLSDEELRQPRTIKAVDYLAGILIANPSRAWEVGPLGHGLHSLRIYDRRVFQPFDPPAAESIAKQLQSGASK